MKRSGMSLSRCVWWQVPQHAQHGAGQRDTRRFVAPDPIPCRRHAERRIEDTGAPGEHRTQNRAHSTQMEKREWAVDDLAGLESPEVDHGLRRRQQVVLGREDAFGPTGGPRRREDGAQRERHDVGNACDLRGIPLEKLLDRVHLDMGRRHGVVGVGVGQPLAVLTHQYGTQARDVGGDREDATGQRPVEGDHLGVAVPELIGQEVTPVGRVDRHRHRAQAAQPEPQRHPVGRRAHEERHPITGLDAETGKHVGGRDRPFPQRPVRQGDVVDDEQRLIGPHRHLRIEDARERQAVPRGRLPGRHRRSSGHLLSEGTVSAKVSAG